MTNLEYPDYETPNRKLFLDGINALCRLHARLTGDQFKVYYEYWEDGCLKSTVYAYGRQGDDHMTFHKTGDGSPVVSISPNARGKQ